MNHESDEPAAQPAQRLLGLRPRLLLLVLVALLPLVAVAGYGADRLLETARREAAGRALDLARNLAREQDRLLATVDNLLFTVGRGVQAGAACGDMARAARRDAAAVTGVAVIGGDGPRCRSGRLGAAADGKALTAAARDGRQGRVTRFMAAGGEVAGPRLAVARAVAAGGDRPPLVVVAAMRLPWYGADGEAWSLPPDAGVLVRPADGSFLRMMPDGSMRRDADVPPKLARALANRRHGRLITASGWTAGHVFGFAPLPGTSGDTPAATVAVGLPRGWLEALPRRLLFLWAAGLVSAIGLAALLVWTVGGRLVLRPVRTLVAAAERLGRGDLSVRCGPPYPAAELGDLAQRFDTMAADLERHENELRQRTEALARSNAELQSFAYVASHDLQEPLRKVRAFGDMLADELGDDLSEDAAQFLRSMQNAGARMESLIQDLLAFSRVQTRGSPFAETDLRAVVDGVTSDLSVRIEETGAHVHAGDLPAIDADEPQMRQLFQNLITNALKFVRPDVTPEVRVEGAPVSDDPAHVRITVTDNGLGIDPRYKDKVFEVFQRLQEPGAYEGTGMGLAICRKIVHRHGGTIDVDGTPGEGTCFTIVLPRHQKKEEGGHA